MARIAIEGQENDIVEIVRRQLSGVHEVRYIHESPYCLVDILSVDELVLVNPDITVVCNAEGYLDFLEYYEQQTQVPVLVLTGGGPIWVEQARKYTQHVLPVPYSGKRELLEVVDQIISHSQHEGPE